MTNKNNHDAFALFEVVSPCFAIWHLSSWTKKTKELGCYEVDTPPHKVAACNPTLRGIPAVEAC